MERTFKVTIDGRLYNVTVEETTENNSIAYPDLGNSFARPAVSAPPPPPPLASPMQASAAIHVPAEPGDVVSTLGGVVESLLVTKGQEVHSGDRVIVIEAMKMKTPITANKSGKVSDILVNVGDGVQTGQVLVKLS